MLRYVNSPLGIATVSGCVALGVWYWIFSGTRSEEHRAPPPNLEPMEGVPRRAEPTNSQLMKKVVDLKAAANGYFGERKYNEALSYYQQALDQLCRFHVNTEKGSELRICSMPEAAQIQHVCLANVVLVLNKLNRFEEATAAASALLRSADASMKNDLRAKVYFRRATAHGGLGRRRPEISDLEKALELSDGNEQQTSEVKKALDQARQMLGNNR